MKRLKAFRELTQNISDIRKPFIMLGVLKVWNLIFGLSPLFLYSLLVDRVLVCKNIDMLLPVVLGYFATYLLLTIGIVVSKYFSNQLTLKYDLRIKNKLLKKYFELSMDVYNKYSIGDVRNRIESDTIAARNFFVDHILEFFYTVIYAVALALILLLYDWRIALISFIFVPITFWVVNFVGRKTKIYGEELWSLQTNYETFLLYNFQNWKDIKTNNLEDVQFNELNSHFKKIKRIWFLNQLFMHIGTTFSYFTRNFITQLFIYFIGGIFVINGYSQVGALLVFINYYGQFFQCVQNVGNSVMNYKNNSVKIEKIIEVLNLNVEERPYCKIDGADIKVENLKYKYEGNQSFILENVSFYLRKGGHLAIVGSSGSGKSTIVKLLTGQIEPQGGSIFIGDINILSVSVESVAEKISVITQEPVLFNMTIKENLLLAKANATDEELVACCQRASIGDFIERLEDKYNTVIGEKGIMLSGGEKQRLSIARAFLQDKDIIIFDESTNALDSEKENDIINGLKFFSNGKTLISIAHRLSTICDCDGVLVLRDGEMIAMDSHQNLYGKNETYDLLFGNQYIHI